MLVVDEHAHVDEGRKHLVGTLHSERRGRVAWWHGVGVLHKNVASCLLQFSQSLVDLGLDVGGWVRVLKNVRLGRFQFGVHVGEHRAHELLALDAVLSGLMLLVARAAQI